MVLEPYSQTLLIYAGRRDDKFLGDMYAYHIPTDTVTELFANAAQSGGPEASFTQRALIDPELREIYMWVHHSSRHANERLISPSSQISRHNPRRTRHRDARVRLARMDLQIRAGG